jgi:hypothetical protein
MQYCEHEAKLNVRRADGSTRRDEIMHMADRGDLLAALELDEGPECPPGFEHLVDWSRELYGRSGVGMDGAAPLSFTTVRDWSALTGHSPSPWEIQALMAMDSAMRPPREDAPEKRDFRLLKGGQPRKVKNPRWPQRKA